MAHDLAMVPLSVFLAYWLRYNLAAIDTSGMRAWLRLMPVILACQATFFLAFGLYRGLWRFASIPDLLAIARAVGSGTVLWVLVMFTSTRLEGVPRSVIVLQPMVLVLLLGGPRVLYRLLKERRLSRVRGPAALIIGAGETGELLARDLLRDTETGYRPLGFLDDDEGKRGLRIHGIPVVGPVNALPKQVLRLGVDVVLLAVPSGGRSMVRTVTDLAAEVSVPVRTVPGLGALAGGSVSVTDIRPVSLEDLLGRDPVHLDWGAITQLISGHNICVTGAGGSIGAELSRQLARLGPRRLLLVDHGEHNLFRIERELRLAAVPCSLEPMLLDVCDEAAVDRMLAQWRPSAVFHAAAYKHVPLVEENVLAGLRNNVIGTEVMARAALRHGVRTFVLVSTDKAVNPTSVMGATKRLAEMLCGAMDGPTAFVTVRFGNVLGSTGSVVPLFEEQIRGGGPVTVTHPGMKRYFMTIPEACELILEAGAVGRGGEIFVLEMGEPVRIADLAQQMVRLSGLLPGRDIEIAYTGIRPGEKLEESLFHQGEMLEPTDHAKLLLATARPCDARALHRGMEAIRSILERGDVDAALRVLQRLIPEAQLRAQPETDPAAPGFQPGVERVH
jgi:FlaA1/EpsC-like NDP-sugar epimerase